MTKYFSRVASAARRAARLDQYSSLKDTFGKREANMRLTSQNVGPAAISMVREILDSYSLPNRPQLGYSGIRAARLASNNKIDGGVITVHAEFRTRTGVNVGIDVPVEVRGGNLIEPSVVVFGGSPRIIAQSTFDDIVAHNTFTEQARIRPMYSAPLDKNQHELENKYRREQTRINKGLYSAAIRDALAGKTAQLDLSAKSPPGKEKMVEKLKEEGYDADSAFAIAWAQHNKEHGKSAQYVEHDYKSFDPARNVDPEDFLQPAEQEPGLAAGDTTSLSEEVEVRNRGGGVDVYSSGSKVTVVRDLAGDGTAYVVEFDDGLQAVIDSGLLKSAQQQAPAVQAKEPMRGCLSCGKEIFTPFGQGSSAPGWQGHFCSERCRNKYISK